MASNLFFTYGTLMRGEPRPAALASAKFLGEADLPNARLFDTGYGFPALQCPVATQLKPSDAFQSVRGEVYEIEDKATWDYLDQIEAGLYSRQEHAVYIPTRPIGHRHTAAQVYVWNEIAGHFAELRVIPGGSWTEGK